MKPRTITSSKILSWMFADILIASMSTTASGENQEITNFEYRDFQQGKFEFETQDYDAAFAYWFSLAREGVPEAQYNVGRMYAYGEGVPKNYQTAYAWFLRAEHNGAPEAVSALEQVGDYLNRDQINNAKTEAGKSALMESGVTDADPRPRQFGAMPVPEKPGDVAK